MIPSEARLIPLLLTAALLTACGGGSSSSGSSTSSSSGGTTGSTAGGTTSGGTTSGGTTSGGTSSGGTSSGGTSSGGTTSGGTTTAGDASVCLNRTLYQTATTVVLNYDISGALTGTSASTSTNSPSASFQGSTAAEWNQSVVTTYSGQAPATVANKFYYQLDGNVVVELGNIATITSPVSGTITTVFSPAFRDQRWTLAAGGEFTGTRNAQTSTVLTGLPAVPATSTSTALKVQYDGRESVTVPSGTYNACKFTENSGEQVLWFEPQFGTMVKSISTGSGGTTTLQLSSGTVNGAAI